MKKPTKAQRAHQLDMTALRRIAAQLAENHPGTVVNLGPLMEAAR